MSAHSPTPLVESPPGTPLDKDRGMNNQRYNVTFLGFPKGTPIGESPVDALQRVFPIDQETARSIVRAAPIVVKHDAPMSAARQYVQSLRSIGAKVELSRMEAPSFVAPPASDAVGPATSTCLEGVGVMPTPIPQNTRRPRQGRFTETTDAPSFLESLPGSFLVPLRGTGARWMLTIIGLTLGALAMSLVPFFGWLLQFLLIFAMLTLYARFFQSCLASTALDEDRPGGLPDTSSFGTEFVLPGIAFGSWFLLTHLPLILWLNTSVAHMSPEALALHPITLILTAIPYLFWPMGLTQTASSGSLFSIFNLPKLILGAARAPGSYLLILGVGVLLSALPLVLVTLIAAPLANAAGCGFIGGILLLLLSTLSMTYAHGVMGAMMGHLIRRNPEIVEQYQADSMNCPAGRS